MDHKICPFYMNKERASGADLILMTYNYMLYESMRPNNTLNYENSIIIFDEAHNVPKCAEDAASFQLDTDTLLQLIFTLKNLQDAIEHSKQKFSSTQMDIEGIRAITSGFLNYLQEYDFNSNEHDQERI
jgi:Rad3-related DNA helicase